MHWLKLSSKLLCNLHKWTLSQAVVYLKELKVHLRDKFRPDKRDAPRFLSNLQKISEQIQFRNSSFKKSSQSQAQLTQLLL